MNIRRPVTVYDDELAQRCARGRVIVIDDDVEILDALRELLALEAYACETYASAKAYLRIQETQPFTDYLWRYLDGKVLQNNFASMAQVPAQTELSTRISKDLKAQGFKFCGPTIVYAFMQATGMVNDHMTSCPCHAKVTAMAR